MSVTDKTGLVLFARRLIKLGWEIISTGGTARELRAGGVDVIDVETVTGFPEMMDGRLKTLHPKVFGGLLLDRDKPAHMEDAHAWAIEPIDMVVVNLYDFAGKPSIEQIDIGGPSLIRAAAKNHIHVIVVVDPNDYDLVASSLESGNPMSRSQRQSLAKKAFKTTAQYDAGIYEHFDERDEAGVLVELGKH